MAIVDTLEAVRKLRNAGMDESQAEAVVEIIGNSSTNLMTKDDAALLESRIGERIQGVKADAHRMEARLFRALWIQGAGIVAIVGTIVAIAVALT